MHDIGEKLDHLLAKLEERGFHLSDNLRPGLSDEELDEWSESRAIKLPAELRALFHWRNGSIDRTLDIENCLLFRDNVFVGLEDYDEIIEGCKHFVSGFESDGGVFPFPITKSVPIAELEGNVYLVPTIPFIEELASPVIVVGEDLAVHFLSISSMLDTSIAWAGDPGFTPDNRVPRHEEDAWRIFNPGVFEIEI